jgi:hypothetical protein
MKQSYQTTSNIKTTIMKTIIMAISIFIVPFFNYSYANGNNAMDKILEKGISFKSGELPSNNNQNEFVRISFHINNDNKIEIIETNSSNEFIKDQLVEKLTSLSLFGALNIGKTYYYNFTFKKK